MLVRKLLMAGVMRRVGFVLALAGVLLTGRYLALRDRPPAVDRSTPEWAYREEALSRAGVFLRDVDVRQSPPLIAGGEPLRCAYVPTPASGTTPKFECRLATGEVVKVKYGDNPEIPAEVAATRLLRALGFATDDVWPVPELECAGCPPHPYRTRQLAEMLFLASLHERVPRSDAPRRFRHVAVERKFRAPAIEAGEATGWDWSELDRVDQARGGASVAELDALRLAAVLLAHWDNKPSNQRLVCLDPADAEAAGEPGGASSEPRACRRPLLMIHDLGATFGPKKLNHRNWSRTPLWAPGSPCVATMASLPYEGATFRPRPIAAEGRALLAGRFVRLSPADLEQIFQEAGFPDVDTGEPRARDVSPWVRTLQQKVAEITHPPCASSS